MTMSRDELSANILKEMTQTQHLLDQSQAPKDALEGLTRMATAIGDAVVDYLLTHAEVHVTVISTGSDATGTLK